MSFSYKLKSHQSQLLKDHLNGVAQIALETHRSHGGNTDIDGFIKIVSMAHDFGKGTTFFQDYIEGKYNGRNKNHGELSAIFTYWMLPEKWKHLGYLLIKRHHGNIKNAFEELNYDKYTWNYYDQIKDMEENHKKELEDIYSIDLNEFFKFALDEKALKSIRRSFRKNRYNVKDILLLQYVYSLLLTADKSQLIRGDTYIPQEFFSSDFVNKYKNILVRRILDKNKDIKDTEIFKVRNEIYDELEYNLQKIDIDNEKIFSINVPTGTGKTLLSYKAAFKIAEKISNKKPGIYPNIIYCLPFMSIIDQNYEILRELLQKNLEEEIKSKYILKYHSMTPIEYDNYESYDARFCFENWQAKIITTTFVQLFNTIFKIGKNSIANRFHRLSNSVIILDEVQVINEKYYLIIQEFFKKMAKEYNCYVILVTATMPILLEAKELIEQKELYFKRLNRIEIHNNAKEEIDIEDFKDALLDEIVENKDKSYLIVMNTVKSSKEVYSFLQENCEDEERFIYLSTEIYPKLRLKIIDKIRNSNKKYVVISTQLIEAGVDIDMDIVIRDFAPLDSINQTAGRANRNGLGGKGIVRLYKIVNQKGKRYCSFVYPYYLLKTTEEILENRNVIHEKDIYDLNIEYYEKINDIKSDSLSKDMLTMIEKLEIENFRKKFELIENDELYKEDIFVIADAEAEEILNEIRNNETNEQVELLNMFRKLNQYRASVSKRELEEGKINYKEIEKYGIKYIEKDDFNEKKGILRKSIEFF
jgi:CRISPR-associated endonuclease/helicase Cas3